MYTFTRRLSIFFTEASFFDSMRSHYSGFGTPDDCYRHTDESAFSVLGAWLMDCQAQNLHWSPLPLTLSSSPLYDPGFAARFSRQSLNKLWWYTHAFPRDGTSVRMVE